MASRDAEVVAAADVDAALAAFSPSAISASLPSFLVQILGGGGRGRSDTKPRKRW